MNIKYKVLFLSTVILILVLSACSTAIARELQDNEGNIPSIIENRVEQSQGNDPTAVPEAIVASEPFEAGAPDPQEPVSAENPEDIPDLEDRNAMLDGVNLGIDQPVEEEVVTGPEPGTETEPAANPDEVPADDEMDDVNMGTDQAESEDTAPNLIDKIISFFQQLLSSILASSDSSQA